MTFDIKQIAERYMVSPSTVSGWIANNELDAFVVSRAAGSRKPRYRVTEEALAAFERRRAVGSQTPATPRRKKANDGVVEFYK